MGEPVSRTQEVLDYFSVMPAYPLRNFLQILCTIQYFINGEKVSVSSFLLDEEDPPKLPVFYAPDMPAPEHFMHNTLELEERLLAVTKKSEVEIAEYLGYSSQSYFVKVFKKIHGVTPGEFRKG